MISKSDIKLIKSLEQKKFRKLHQLFTIEGERLVSEALNSQIHINQLLITDVYLSKQKKSFTNLLSGKDVIINTVTEKEIKGLSGTVSPSGILAICTIPPKKTINIQHPENWLFLDTIQDPGNLGTLLRSANWFGVRNVALSDNCIDLYNPKVVRGGMGSHFNLNIFEQVSLKSFYESKHTVIGAFQTGQNIKNIDPKDSEPWILVIGNEAHGINKQLHNLIDKKISIPQIGAGESLNAAVAGSILLYQLTK